MNVFKRVGAAFKAFRSTLANPSEWFMKLLTGGSRSKSGIEVNSYNALEVSTVFACCNIIASTIASLPLGLYIKTKEGKTKDEKHNLNTIFSGIANDETTSYEFWIMFIFNLLLTGDGFAKVIRNKNGKILALYNIPSGNVKIYRNDKTNEKFYEVTTRGIEKEILYREDIFHVKGNRFSDTDKSINPVTKAREALGLAFALEEYASDYFSNGANASGIVEYPGTLSDKAYERFKSEFIEKHTGLKNSGKVIFLEQGLKFNQTSNDPEKSQSIESRKFQAIEICRFFNVPPNKVFDFDRMTFSNAEQVNISFVVDCITPMCVRIEQSIKLWLMLPSERVNSFPKFNVNGLLRGDINARRNFYQAGIQNGWYSPNDIRELEDENKYEGGDTYFVNGNMIPVKFIEDKYKNEVGE